MRDCGEGVRQATGGDIGIGEPAGLARTTARFAQSLLGGLLRLRVDGMSPRELGRTAGRNRHEPPAGTARRRPCRGCPRRDPRLPVAAGADRGPGVGQDPRRAPPGGRRRFGDGESIVVTGTGLAISFCAVGGRRKKGEVLTGTFSSVAVRLDRPGERKDRIWLDLWTDLDPATEQLRERVYAVGSGGGPAGPGAAETRCAGSALDTRAGGPVCADGSPAVNVPLQRVSRSNENPSGSRLRRSEGFLLFERGGNPLER